MNALATIESSEWSVMTQQARVLVASGFLPQHIKNENQAIAIMLKGRELDIPPWAALTSIHVIQGNPTISPQLMLALIQRSGLLEDIKIEGDSQKCVVMMKRKGQSPYSVTFTINDAALMGLQSKQNWKSQPGVMLKWRAISACARVVFADILLGMYTTEEINPDQSITAEGEIIDMPIEPPTPPQEGTEAAVPDNNPETPPDSKPADGIAPMQDAPNSGETAGSGENHDDAPPKEKLPRPLGFADLKQMMAKKVAKSTAPDAPITDGQRKMMFATLGRLFALVGEVSEDDQKRFVCELFDVKTRSAVTTRQLEALNAWAVEAEMAAQEIKLWLNARQPATQS
jgi:hypothetical protein